MVSSLLSTEFCLPSPQLPILHYHHYYHYYRYYFT